MGLRRCVLVVVLAGCGRLSFDAQLDASDGAVADASMFSGDTVEYLKASNADPGDLFGGRIALSHDGTRMVVSAMGKDTSTGAAYVFVRTGGTWMEEAVLTASNAEPMDQFSRYVAMSADGTTLAVSANKEDSAGGEASNGAIDSGAAYVFTRAGSSWTQHAYIKPTVIGAGDDFGTSIALSGDGATLLVGAFNEGGQSGAAYVFVRTGTSWVQQAVLEPTINDAFDRFGEDVALSADGNVAAVGAPLESSNARGVNGDATDNSIKETGAAYIFVRTGTSWAQEAYVKASNTAASDGLGSFEQFGWSVILSAAGDTFVVGARLEGSAATGIDGDQDDQSATSAGAVYVFARAGNTWAQQAYIKASNTGMNDFFGETARLSADGNTLAVTAPFEDGSATGIGGSTDEAGVDAGAVYMFRRDAMTWSQMAYVKGSTTDPGDSIAGLALSGDATTLAIGAAYEDGGTRGVGGDPSDDSSPDAGAVFVYW